MRYIGYAGIWNNWRPFKLAAGLYSHWHPIWLVLNWGTHYYIWYLELAAVQSRHSWRVMKTFGVGCSFAPGHSFSWDRDSSSWTSNFRHPAKLESIWYDINWLLADNRIASHPSKTDWTASAVDADRDQNHVLINTEAKRRDLVEVLWFKARHSLADHSFFSAVLKACFILTLLKIFLITCAQF